MNDVDPALEAAITALMTCAPLECAHETECFRVARFARDQMRAAYAQKPSDRRALPLMDPDAIEDYAPAWRQRPCARAGCCG